MEAGTCISSPYSYKYNCFQIHVVDSMKLEIGYFHLEDYIALFLDAFVFVPITVFIEEI